MSAHRYSRLAGLMRRELLVAGQLRGLTDLQVSVGATAKLRGGSGQIYLPDVVVRTARQLHVIYMKSWRRVPSAEEVMAAQVQVHDVAAANSRLSCTLCIFASEPNSETTLQFPVEAGVLVLAPPHCSGYAQFVVEWVLDARLLGLQGGTKGLSLDSPQSAA